MLLILPFVQATVVAPTSAEQLKRLDEAQALLSGAMRHGFSYGSKISYLKAIQSQPELLKAWDLLNGSSWEQGLRSQRDLLRVEIAWRLQDSKKMKEAMVAYAAPSVLSKKEEAYAFMASGQVGQADLFLRLGKDIEARGGLGGFHQKALEDISFFDFAAMYKALVGGQPVSLVGDIQDQGYSVRHIKVRVGSTYGSSDQARALVNLIRSQASDEWRDRPDSPISLVRIGQSVHWAEAPSSPPYTGFMSSDRLFMEGYLENDTPGDAGTQVQTFDMKREVGASNHWSGNNTIQAFTPDKAGKPKEVLRVVLNYQWDLVPE